MIPLKIPNKTCVSAMEIQKKGRINKKSKKIRALGWHFI